MYKTKDFLTVINIKQISNYIKYLNTNLQID